MAKRPTIPLQTQNELWARAAGRCQFRGCNIIVYKDSLTNQSSNLGVISHIVAFSPQGPRGDAVRSKVLEKDIKNLILTCRDHGKLIDDASLVQEYPEQLLLEFKHDHETRIRRVTESIPNQTTYVLIVQVPIDGLDFSIQAADAHRAIQPKYPAEEHPMRIDLTATPIVIEGDLWFRMMASMIKEQLDRYLVRRNAQPVSSLSVFALAPIPLLIYLGHQLGSITNVELYQYQQNKSWVWANACQKYGSFEHIPTSDFSLVDTPIALIFSVSGFVDHKTIAKILGSDVQIYEIRAEKPSRSFLQSKEQIKAFAHEIQTMLNALRQVHYHRRPIHVFSALPAPLAIEFGRHIRSLDTPFVLYEYEKSNHSYRQALRLNDE